MPALSPKMNYNAQLGKNKYALLFLERSTAQRENQHRTTLCKKLRGPTGSPFFCRHYSNKNIARIFLLDPSSMHYRYFAFYATIDCAHSSTGSSFSCAIHFTCITKK